MKKKLRNLAIRSFMYNHVLVNGAMSSTQLVSDTKRAFPKVTRNVITGNLSAECCYYKNLSYLSGIVS